MTTATQSLTDFLLARVAEDEAAARAATTGPWFVAGRDGVSASADVVDADGDRYNWGPAVMHASFEDNGTANAAHIARHDPARVLAECEAKQRIVEYVAGWRHHVIEDCWYTCAAATEEADGGECCDDGRRGSGCDCGLESRRAKILGPISAVYADHPDYRVEWAL